MTEYEKNRATNATNLNAAYQASRKPSFGRPKTGGGFGRPNLLAIYQAKANLGGAATTGAKTKQPPNPLDTFQKQQEKALTAQYAQLRTGLGAQKDELGRQMSEGLARRRAIMGEGSSGAILKAQEKGTAELGKQYAAAESALGAEEIGQKSQLASNVIQLKQQSEQFWAEMDENKRTNVLNAMVAAKDAGLLDKKTDELAGFWASGLAHLYPGRLPFPTLDNTQQFYNTGGAGGYDPQAAKNAYNAGLV